MIFVGILNITSYSIYIRVELILLSDIEKVFIGNVYRKIINYIRGSRGKTWVHIYIHINFDRYSTFTLNSKFKDIIFMSDFIISCRAINDDQLYNKTDLSK